MRSRLITGSFVTFLSPTVRSSRAGQSFTQLTSCSTVLVTEKTKTFGLPPLLSQQKVNYFNVHTYGPVMLTVAQFVQNHLHIQILFFDNH